MVDLHVRILRVDMNGFCGRDPHPKSAHNGLVGRVVRYEIYADTDPAEDDTYGVYTVVLLDAQGNPTQERFEFIDFEVELVGLVERKETRDGERTETPEETPR